MTTINRSPAPITPTALRSTAPTTAAKSTSSTTSTSSTDQRNQALNQATYNELMSNFDINNLKGTNTDTSGKNTVDASYWFKQGDIDEIAQPFKDALTKLLNQQPPLDPATFQAKANDIIAQFKGDKVSNPDPNLANVPNLKTQQGFISIFLNNLFMQMNRLYTRILTSFNGG